MDRGHSSATAGWEYQGGIVGIEDEIVGKSSTITNAGISVQRLAKDRWGKVFQINHWYNFWPLLNRLDFVPAMS